MAAELFGEISEDAWYGAYGIELLHNFTLIHDDIMDNAPLRRGNPTIHAKYGLTTGILSGDVMCIFAYEQLGKIRNSLPAIIQVFSRTAIEICEGQQLDMNFERRNDVCIEEYLHMIALKTSVLLGCALKMGAISGGALGDNAGKLYTLGKNMGLAFQLQDDFLDAFGNEELLGKQIGGDIKENKKNYLLLKAIENADIFQRKEIEDLLAMGGDDKVPAMLSLYIKTGADIACREAVAHYSRLAFDCLEDLAIPANRKGPLKELAEFLLMRDK
jgi:geranylgeranyl diphosphate synthase type II